MKELIVNADDFGLTAGVNEAILHAHREGVLTSATLMANGKAFEDAVQSAVSSPKLGVGCHLVLVGGRCVAPPREIRTLADQHGLLPGSVANLFARLALGLVKIADIERESRAQIEKIRTAGIEPTHFDTHKHTHIHPQVMEALGRVAVEFGISRVRKPFEELADSWRAARSNGGGLSREFGAAVAVRLAGPRSERLARKHGLRMPDHFLGLSATGKLDSAALRRMIDTLSEGRTEIMCHPGYSDGDLETTGTRLREQREKELSGLVDPAVKRRIEDRGVRLINYGDLN